MSVALPAVIVGAGPYGLSIAAHLRGRGVAFRIFGTPMESWRTRMPAGMFLKSEGFASNLYDPDSNFTLERFCAENRLTYGAQGVPVPLATMAAYGLAFQKRLVPELEQKQVLAIDTAPNGFLVRLEDGETLTARCVVLACGISYFQYLPGVLAQLHGELLSHSSEHHELGRFKDREVTVIGAGASALDLAGLLHEAGASVQLVARRRKISWTDPPVSLYRPLWERMRYPMSGMGPGLRAYVFEAAPMLFRHLPQRTRLDIVSSFLGPAPPWFMKDKVVGKVPLLLGRTIERVEALGGRIRLQLGGEGAEREILSDHVIAATGYKVDLRRLPFLGEKLRSRLLSVDDTPVLSANFEASLPGLYFAGLASANTFGPVMRFMIGADYTARRLSAHIAGSSVRPVVSRPEAAMSSAGT
jgi:hypothetical protein